MTAACRSLKPSAIAVASLRANKLRSFLTVLGILIGVSSVIAVVAIIEGLDRYIAEKVLELGTKSFSVQKCPTSSRARAVDRDAASARTSRWRTSRRCARGCAAVLRGGRAWSPPAATRSTGAPRQHDVRVMGITENYSRIGTIRDLLDRPPPDRATTWTTRGPWR